MRRQVRRRRRMRRAVRCLVNPQTAAVRVGVFGCSPTQVTHLWSIRAWGDEWLGLGSMALGRCLPLDRAPVFPGLCPCDRTLGRREWQAPSSHPSMTARYLGGGAIGGVCRHSPCSGTVASPGLCKRGRVCMGDTCKLREHRVPSRSY